MKKKEKNRPAVRCERQLMPGQQERENKREVGPVKRHILSHEPAIISLLIPSWAGSFMSVTPAIYSSLKDT